MSAKIGLMKIGIGSDHAGFELKNKVSDWLIESGYTLEDKGAYSPESVDYPDYSAAVAKDVSENKVQKGIMICGSGIGMTMAANKINGVRAANCYNEETAKMSRAHNDANVLALGARYMDADMAFKIVKVFLETEFEGGRHQRRVNKINKLEESS